MPNTPNIPPPSIDTLVQPIRIFYDRRMGSIDGVLSVVDATGKKLIDKLPARSGQNGYTETNWVPAKSPIPLWQPQVTYYLHLKPIEDNDVFPTRPNGIGLFFPISTHAHNPALIEQGSNKRWHVGLHPENAYPGSAGCIVLLWNTPLRKAKVEGLFALLKILSKSQNVVQLTVL